MTTALQDQATPAFDTDGNIRDQFLAAYAVALNHKSPEAETLYAAARQEIIAMKAQRHATDRAVTDNTTLMDVLWPFGHSEHRTELAGLEHKHQAEKRQHHHTAFGLWAIETMKTAADQGKTATIPTRADYAAQGDGNNPSMTEALRIAQIG